MTDFAAFVVSALVAIGACLFLFLLLAGVFQHRARSRERARRRGGYLR